MARLFFTLIIFSFLCVGAASAQSADVQFDDKTDPDSKDMDALRRWLQDKRLVTMREIGGDLSLSGEVRVRSAQDPT